MTATDDHSAKGASRTVISVDAMGGDRGPAAVVAGIRASADKNPVIRFIVHGPKDELTGLISRRRGMIERCEIRDATGVVEMTDKPSHVLRHGRGTSMWSAIHAVKEGEADVCISCGNTGALMAMLFVIAALLIHGLGISRWLTTAIGTALVGWQVAVTFGDTNTAGPFDFIGSISRWWLNGVQLQDVIGIIGVLAFAAVAVYLAGNLSLEALSRRSSLVSQMKFAVTLQDIRTVVLLRRQLSQEHMRVKPWVKVPRIFRRDIIVGRGLRSLMHFPLRRIVRMTLLTITAAAALVMAFRGTSPAIVVAGLLLFIVGLDAVEPLSQEVDQPDRTDSLPIERGLLMTKHLIVPAVAMTPFLLTGVLTAFILEPQVSTIAYGFLIGIPAVLAGVAGASVNAVKGAPDPVGGANQGLALPPEMSGMGTVIRSAFPPAISIAGCLPVIALQRSVENGSLIFTNTLRASLAVLLVLGLVAGWVRQRDAILIWFRNAQKTAQTSKAEGN